MILNQKMVYYVHNMQWQILFLLYSKVYPLYQVIHIYISYDTLCVSYSIVYHMICLDIVL